MMHTKHARNVPVGLLYRVLSSGVFIAAYHSCAAAGAGGKSGRSFEPLCIKDLIQISFFRNVPSASIVDQRQTPTHWHTMPRVRQLTLLRLLNRHTYVIKYFCGRWLIWPLIWPPSVWSTIFLWKVVMGVPHVLYYKLCSIWSAVIFFDLLALGTFDLLYAIQ